MLTIIQRKSKVDGEGDFPGTEIVGLSDEGAWVDEWCTTMEI